MIRTLQLQLLAWLATLALLGAVVRPTTDTFLFAGTFLMGTLVLHLRNWMHGGTSDASGALGGRAPSTSSATRGSASETVGRFIGATLAWAAVVAKVWHLVPTPTRLATWMLVTAAVPPTIGFVLGGVGALRASRARRGEELGD